MRENLELEKPSMFHVRQEKLDADEEGASNIKFELSGEISLNTSQEGSQVQECWRILQKIQTLCRHFLRVLLMQ